jgi:RNA polymerase sigma factor (sigma-70 family)
MGNIFKINWSKKKTKNPCDEFKSNERLFYESLKSNTEGAWECLWVTMYNQFAVPQSNQNYGDDLVLDGLVEGMAIIKDNIITGTYQFREDAKISTYSYQICRNSLLKLYRIDKNRPDFLNPIFENDSSSDDIDSFNRNDGIGNIIGLGNESDKDHSWALKPLEITFNNLGERCKLILKAFYVDETDDAAICQTLNINPSSIREIRRRCKERLLQEFNEIKNNYL